MRVCLISACTINPPDSYHQQYVDVFLATAKKMGYDPIVIKGGFPYGLGTKLCMYRDFIADHHNEFDIIICSDGYDVMFQLPKEELVKRFLEFNAPIVCSSESTCSPWPEKHKHRYPESPTPYPYLNAGFIVGYESAMLELTSKFTDETVSEMRDDQGILTEHFLANQEPRIVLDYYQSLCNSLYKFNGHLEYDGKVFKNIVTNTVPCVFHGNGGWSKEKLIPIIDTLYPELSLKERALECKLKVCLVSACTEIMPPYIARYHAAFMTSAKKMGFDPIILKKPWPYGVQTKILIYKEFLEQHGDKYDIVICSDAYDVIFQRSKRELIHEFLKFNAPIVCNSEVNCWPNPERDKHRYPPAPTPYAHLNSGFIIGYSKDLLKMWSSFTLEQLGPAFTDQDLLSEYFVEGREPRITLDYQQELCQCLFMSDEHLEYVDDIFNSEFRNKITGRFPCVLHSNCTKKFMEPFIEKLLPEVEKAYPERTAL